MNWNEGEYKNTVLSLSHSITRAIPTYFYSPLFEALLTNKFFVARSARYVNRILVVLWNTIDSTTKKVAPEDRHHKNWERDGVFYSFSQLS